MTEQAKTAFRLSAENTVASPSPLRATAPAEAVRSRRPQVAVLTGGGDKPYALGMAAALADAGLYFDFIGSDDLAVPEILENRHLVFLNLRGDQSPSAPGLVKMRRVLVYYARLLRYAITSRAGVFHILWNNKFEWFDRTALLLYYKLCGRKVVFTAHNVNTQARDGKDSWFNRFTLKMFYRRLDQIFVHTTRMKQELLSEYDVSAAKVTVIPFGINNTLPRSALTRAEARQRLGLEPTDKTILFFGNIAPYKGLEYLLEAFSRLVAQGSGYKLVVAGQNVKCDPEYWSRLDAMMNRTPERDFIVREIKFIPDSEVELYFKASDLLVLPYTQIFQSGVLFLSYSFGLPVLAADVGALKEEIVEGATGLVCQPQDPSDLAKRINQYFASSLYARLEEEHREKIQGYANDRYSWSKVIALTSACYSNLTGRTSRAGSAEVIAK